MTQQSPSEAPTAESGQDLFVQEPRGKVAVVDDDDVTRQLLRGWLETAGYDVVDYCSGSEAFAGAPSDLAVACVDLGLGDTSGIAVMRKLLGRDGELPVIVITANRQLEMAVEAMRAGACDYVTKPLDPARTLAAVDHAIEQRVLKAKLRAAERGSAEIACALNGSAKGRELGERIDALSGLDTPVWIIGERGTGKSAIAKMVHAKSGRNQGRFSFYNVAPALKPHLPDLWGTDGPYAEAADGSLVIKYPEAMSQSDREELLRRLAQGGGSPRVMFLSENNPTAAWPEVSWRDLSVVSVPPLRERKEDIPYLARRFLQILDSPGPNRVRAEAIEVLMAHDWPGNVRQLEVVLQTAALACEGSEIRAEDLPPSVTGNERSGIKDPESSVVPLKELERQAIEQALRVTEGSVTRAAKMLGMGRATLYRRLAHLGLATDSSPGSN